MRGSLANWMAPLRSLSLRPERGQISAAYWWAIPMLPVLLLMSVVMPYNILFQLACLWGWLLVLSWLWVRYQGPRIDLTRKLRSDWTQVGDELEEWWELHNGGRLPLLWLEVSDASTVPEYNARRIAAAGPSSVDHWTTTTICRQRGRYRLGPLAIELSDPLGLFRYRRAETATREMLIYPPLVRLPPFEHPRGQRGGLASTSLLNILPTPNAGAVRDYWPGDPLSYVYWRAVAHTGKLMVKEFDQEIAGAVWIVLDLAHAAQSGSGADSTEELGVVLACSLAHLLLAEGRTVGFFAHGAEQWIVEPGRGRQHLWEFMSTLVDARADGDMPLHDVLEELRSVVPGRQAIAVITPDASGEWAGPLARLSGGGSAALALLVQPPSLPTILRATSRLDQFGIPHITFRTGERLPLIAPPRQRKPGYRISPLGRVVRVEG
jgi:uncharacterized protein (DUF58 family)